MTRRGVFSLILLRVAAFCLILAVGETASAQQTWRCALIIKRKTACTYNGVTVNASMDDTDVAAIKKSFTEYVPAIVSRLSGGQIKWTTQVFDVKDIATSTVIKVRSDMSAVAPPVSDGVKNYTIELAAGYDCVFVYWLNRDPKKSSGGFDASANFGGWPNDGTQGAGYATVAYFPPSTLTANSEQTETFVHEWLHQVEGYYGGAIYLPKPKAGDPSYLHSAEGHGYSNAGNTGDLGFWKRWYQDFLQAKVKEPDGFTSGLGSNVNGLGTIREKRLVNITLPNADQELGKGDWAVVSWANQPNNHFYETTYKVTGGSSLVLIGNKPDDLRASTKVNVKRNTQYRFSAWVKTENVKSERGVGANLSLWNQPEVGRAINDTHDWTYVQLPFNSGNRDSVELCLRLGHHGNLSTGKAWFDNVRLYELH